jgi:signal transduction histidine kinase
MSVRTKRETLPFATIQRPWPELENSAGNRYNPRCFFATRNMGNDSEFEEGRILGHAQEQRKLEMYLHDRLGPELLALVFEIEFIRAQLKADGHPAEPKLREVQNRLSEILAPMHQAIVNGTDNWSEPQ